MQDRSREGTTSDSLAPNAERQRYPRAVWFPAGLSALLLLSMMVAFLWLSRLVDDHRYVLGLRLLAALFPLALAGIVLTAWFAKRAAGAHQRVLENSAQEGLLRDAIAALTGDQVLPAALNRIATNA